MTRETVRDARMGVIPHSKRVGQTPFRELLPESIRDDAAVTAAAASLDPSRRVLALGIPNILLWARLDPIRRYLSPPLQRLVDLGGGLQPLTEAELELLAHQLHVDFRETATTREQLAAMVRESIPWHRIKGTPASLKAALSLFGYGTYTPPGTAASRAAGAQRGPRSPQATAHPAQDARVGEIIIEEDGAGDFWATYQLGLSGITGMDDLARIVAVCREMQPARCRLWRVYTPEYDFRPGVWSGPLPVCAWAQCWWSEYSGAESPDIPGLDDETGLIVSFGARRGVLVSPLCGPDGHAALLLTLNHGRQAPLRLFPAWSESGYGDLFPRDHSFTFAHLYSFTWAEALVEHFGWTGRWDRRRWSGRLLRVDRRLPPWRFHVHGHALTEGVWSGAEPGYTPAFVPNAAHGRILPDVPGTWSGLNAFWGTPRVETLPAPQIWSRDDWSGAVLAPEETEILELVPCLRGAAVAALKPGRPRRAVAGHLSASAAPLLPDAAPGWNGRWDTRRWRGQCAVFAIKTEKESQ